jgi:hypothetical protein
LNEAIFEHELIEQKRIPNEEISEKIKFSLEIVEGM